MMQVLATADDERCVWYGQCPTASSVLNCYYDGPPKPLDASAASTLIDLCPMLNIDPGNAALLLCLSTTLYDGRSINKLQNSVILLVFQI